MQTTNTTLVKTNNGVSNTLLKQNKSTKQRSLITHKHAHKQKHTDANTHRTKQHNNTFHRVNETNSGMRSSYDTPKT